MNKPVVMSPAQWNSVLDRIKQKEKPSTYLSRTKMKEVLGFTVRNHNEWVLKEKVKDDNDSWWVSLERDGWYKDKVHEHTVRLDFYDEQKRTMFLLKYGNGQD